MAQNIIPSALNQIEQEYLQNVIRYSIRATSFLQQQQRIPKIHMSKYPNCYFAHVTDEALQLRAIKRTTVNQLFQQQDLNSTQIMKNSHLVYQYQFEQIYKLDKTVYNINHYLIGVYLVKFYAGDKTKPSFVIRFSYPAIMEQFFELANGKLKQEKQFVKKSATNFLGIEQNIRKIIQKILICSPAKRQIYNRMTQKLQQKKIELNGQNNKIMVYALMGNDPQMQSILRKQKIQAYDIQKRRYDDYLKEQNVTNIAQIIQPSKQHIVEKYSEKRKLDGAILKRQNNKQNQKETSSNQNKIQEQLYFDKIPLRSSMEVDQLIHLKDRMQEMQIQQKPIKQLPFSFKADKVKIPLKQYSIVGRQVQWIKKQPTLPNEILDKNQLVIIESIKFMYQLMKANTKIRNSPSIRFNAILQKIIQSVKQLVTQCQNYKQDQKKPSVQNKSINELIRLANKNYLDYRKNSAKFF